MPRADVPVEKSVPAAADVVENHSSTEAVVDALTRWSGSVVPATVPGNFAAVESVNGPGPPSVAFV